MDMEHFGLQIGLNKVNAFEGWFFKVDDRKNDLMFSVIWGYSTHKETKHTFIQFQDSVNHSTAYITYPLEEMKWENSPFTLRVGKNMLSQTNLHLDFMFNNNAIHGDFSFSELIPIKKSLLKPNIMGLLSYAPKQCNHAIISMSHKVEGNLQLGNKIWEIQDARGYIEKDWGTGFPKEYVWLQTNYGDNNSVVFSYATVPLLGKHAKGFFLVLYHDGKEYRFSSIEGSSISNFNVSEDSFSAVIKKGKTIVTLCAKQKNSIALVSPENGEMKSSIKESLEGLLYLTLEIANQPTLTLNLQQASIDINFHEKIGQI